MADEKTLPNPILRTEKYLAKIAENTANLDPTPTILQANKTITQNGVVEPDSGFDGFAKVTANVPNTYTAADEGKVVDNGELVTQIPTIINTNTTVDTTLYNQVTVSVPNTYTAEDEGKVVDNGALVAQTSTNITSNGTVNTTLNNQAVVNVPNTYTAGDEGKVVDNGALVAQTAYPTEITVNDTYDTTNYNSITVNVPTGGGGSVEEKDVNFYDYDGTCVYSYTAQEFLALDAMPANPDRSSEGLTAQGWNWSFADAVDYVRDYSVLDVGQMYVTTDEKTKIYITLYEGKLHPYLYLKGSGDVTIDWGDGSTTDNYATTRDHQYAKPGNYVISLTVTNGTRIFEGGNYSYATYFICDTTTDYSNVAMQMKYLDCVNKIELGSNINISEYAFALCIRLKSITIPNSITSIGEAAFKMCSQLNYITIPNNVSNIYNNAFGWCTSLRKISLPNKQPSLTLGSGIFRCSGLTRLSIPKTVTTIPNSAFRATVELAPAKTGLSNGYIGLYSLSDVVLPNTITTIEDYAFTDNTILKSITIPTSVTSIGAYAFKGTTGASYGGGLQSLSFIKFLGSTPPTASANAFGVPTDCIIYVPALVSNLYMTAQYYPNPSNYNYIGYATYTSGDTLPTLTTDETYTLTWYATVEDAIAQTNPITVGNGNEIYSRATAVV